MAGDPLTIVLAGGAEMTAPLVRPLPRAARVIAADGGILHAPALGLTVDVLIGDLDSTPLATLGAAALAGTEVVEHPSDKDATDLELALDRARDEGAGRVLVIGGHGGRLDHLLGNVGLLAADRYRGLRLTALLGGALVTVVHDARALSGRAGETVTLLAAHGGARGVTTTGLAFPLADDELLPGSSRGVSNRFLGARAEVRVATGALLAVQPEPDPEDPWP
ncbi:MAG: hypothetical protein RLZZ272_467 [Actinomycetota bacterium]